MTQLLHAPDGCVEKPLQRERRAAELQRFLDELPGKEHTEVVCIDLSETYRAIVKRHFANAIIVADRFHVIRLIGQYLMEAWKQLEPVGRKHRGLISLMRRKPANLDPEQQVRLQAYFTEHPMVAAVYDQLQRLMQLLRNKHQKAKQCRWHIRHYLRIVNDFANRRCPCCTAWRPRCGRGAMRSRGCGASLRSSRHRDRRNRRIVIAETAAS